MIEGNEYQGGHPASDGYLAAPAVKEPEAPRPGVTERLQELEQLRAKGLISHQEYATKRRRIIDEI
jgi:hypothetical protein